MYKHEMMIHVPMCTHESPKKVGVIGDLLLEEFKKYKNTYVTQGNIEKENVYDVIISDTSMDIQEVYRTLNEKGLYVTKCDSLTDMETFHALSEHFYIVMPYYFFNEEGCIESLVLASKAYHPQADIVRNVSDFIEAEYYNTDMHLCAFNYPTKIFETIKDSVRL